MCRRAILALAVLVWLALPPAFACAQPPEPEPGSVVHIVQRGDTLLSIARQYGATVDAIAHTNGIGDPREIYLGQRLVIPSRGRVRVEETIPHVVAAGETLDGIAKRHRTTWQTLSEINGLLSPSVIYAGQVIRVPALDAPGESDTGAGQTVGGIIHVVRPRETLVGIAVRHGVSMWSILGASHIANPALIYPGQELLVPGEGSGYLPAPFLWVDVQPLPAGQGSTAVVAVRLAEPVTLTATVLGQTIRFSEEAGVYYGLVGVHAFFEPGVYELVLSATDGAGEDSTLSTGFVVDAGPYGYERINVPASRTNLLDAEVVAAERARLDQLAQTYTRERRWTGPLMRPGTGTVSSYFGTRRCYGQGPYTSYHAGTDFRGPTGTPVYVSAAGTVVLAEMLAIHGNMVVVDHGWGVLTGYAHLSSMGVMVGQQVEAGDMIGEIGNTGLSTAAHLHWQVWVSGISVDGLQWLEANYPWPRLDVRDAGDVDDLAALPTESRSADVIAGPPWVAGLAGLLERSEMNGQGGVGQGATIRPFGTDPVGAPRTL